MKNVYVIKNNLNDKVYYGQALNIKSRIRRHKSNFMNSRGSTYKSMRDDGLEWSNLIFEVLNTDLTSEMADIIEKTYIKNNDCYNRVHNQDTKDNRIGNKLTEEHKKKISDSCKGYKHTDEAKKKISDSCKGRTPYNKGLTKEQMLEYKKGIKNV